MEVWLGRPPKMKNADSAHDEIESGLLNLMSPDLNIFVLSCFLAFVANRPFRGDRLQS